MTIIAIVICYLAGYGGQDLDTHVFLTSTSRCILYLGLHLEGIEGNEESKEKI